MDPTPIRLLFLKDVPEDVLLLQSALEEPGEAAFELLLEDDLSGALQRLKAETVDVALLAVSLPESTALDAVKRTVQAAPHVPIVVLSDLSNEALALSAVKEGVQDHLVRSEINGRILRRSLRYAIERKRAEESLRVEREHTAHLKGVLQTIRTLQHEINNPLQALLTNLELLQQRMAPETETQRIRLQRLMEASSRISGVVQRISQVTKHETVPSPVGEMLRLPEPASDCRQ